MSEYELLYESIKQVINTNFNTVFGYIGETEIDEDGNTIPVKDTIAMYFKGGFVGSRNVTNGQYFYEQARVVFNVYGNSTVDGIKDTLTECDRIKKLLDSTNNIKFLYPQNDISIIIMCTTRSTNINDLGRNEQGIPVYSINYNIKYRVGGN